MSGERARLFVALELPDQVREGLTDWRRVSVGNVRGLRLVAPESLHVTLCFLGSQPESEIDRIAAVCERTIAAIPEGAVPGPREGMTPGPREGANPGPRPALSVARVIWLPPRRPAVLAVEIEDPEGELAGVQRVLSTALEFGGWYAPEPRPFLAHVTVGRVSRGARIKAKDVPAPPRLRFDATTVTLFRSRPMAGGSRYEPLMRVSLG